MTDRYRHTTLHIVMIQSQSSIILLFSARLNVVSAVISLGDVFASANPRKSIDINHCGFYGPETGGERTSGWADV